VSLGVGVGCAVLGAAVGPFLAGLTLRVPAGEPVRTGGAWRGEPAGGRRLVTVTVLAALVLGAIGVAIGAEPELLAYLWLGLVAVPLAVIDVETLRLPDRLTLPGFVVGLALLVGASRAADDWGALWRALAAAVVVGGTAFLFALVVGGGAGLGLGDVKLLALLALFLGRLGWGHVVLGVALGFLLGALAAVALLAARRAGLKDSIPFGQWLIAGALIAVVAGKPILDAYLGTDPG
jgi:leader peptidase (prepilin peptidase) / N-methyltransferase